MHIPKRYGSYQSHKCPFCSKSAVTENKQGVPVCTTHKVRLIPEQKCICGKMLELKAGKFGPYFVCMNCGNINFNKVNLELISENSVQELTKTSASQTPNKPKEIVIRSDDPYYFN